MQRYKYDVKSLTRIIGGSSLLSITEPVLTSIVERMEIEVLDENVCERINSVQSSWSKITIQVVPFRGIINAKTIYRWWVVPTNHWIILLITEMMSIALLHYNCRATKWICANNEFICVKWTISPAIDWITNKKVTADQIHDRRKNYKSDSLFFWYPYLYDHYISMPSWWR